MVFVEDNQYENNVILEIENEEESGLILVNEVVVNNNNFVDMVNIPQHNIL